MAAFIKGQNDIEAKAVTGADESDLLTKIADGDQRAMEALFTRYYPVIYAFAMRRLGEGADAADVVNEVMLEVWNRAWRFEGRSKVSTWLLGIANFKIIDVMRKRKRRDADEFDDDMHADETGDGFDLLAAGQNRDWVKRCIEKLKDIHAQIVHLAFYQELSYTEIAEIVACPAGTVKTRMMHAKQKLKQCLQAAA